MARNITVTPEMLNTAAAQIEQLASDYKTQYENIYGKADEMSAKWKGKDNQAYIEQIRGFEDDLKKMYALMTKYAEFLRNSAKAYSEIQDEIATKAKTLTN